MERFKIIYFVLLLSLVFIADINAEQTSIDRIMQMGSAKEYALSLDDVTKLAFENNFDIQLLKYDVLTSKAEEGITRSIYDTLLNAEVSHQDNRRKQTSTLFGTQEVDKDYNLSLSKKTPTGTTLGLGVSNNRNSTNSSFATSSTTHDSTTGLSVSQELGKNFFGLIDRNSVKLTRLDIENTEYLSLDSIEDQIAMIQKAYWDLVLEYENENNQLKMVAQAKRLYDLQKEKLVDGLVELAEAVASEANYQQRVSELLLIRNQILMKENNLKTLLNLELNSSVKIVPTDTLLIAESSVDLKSSLTSAIENRRDYKQAINAIKESDINLAMKKNSRWPEIDLNASWAQNGLGDHFDESLGNSIEEDNFNAFIGLTLSMPLENSKAKAELKQADFKKAKALLMLKKVENIIALDIVNQVKTVEVFFEVANQHTQIARLQEEKLSEEEKRFNRGRSATDTLIRFQEDAIQAKVQELQSKRNYLVALVNLKQKQGTLLDQYWEGEF